MIIAVDFDGTCTTHNFPGVGKDIGAAPVLRRLVDEGHQLILWTMRSRMEYPQPEEGSGFSPAKGDHLKSAEEWFERNNIPLFGVQRNPTQDKWTTSPKCYAELYIDDAALGCPLIYPGNGERPYADWDAISKLLFKD